MVIDYFNLREHPFGVTPDSKYLYLGDTHREALASITYGVEAGCGFVALIAPPGLGKTTLLFHAMNQLRDRARTVFLFQTVCTPLDLLRALLSGLGVHEFKGSLIEMQLKLKDVLLDEFRLGKRVVVVIDEAQNLDDSVLELVRMLSNYETSRDKLLQIVLSGQPQLAEKIASPELVQLRQRVSIVAQLSAFSPKETALYIEHRLRLAGYSFDAPMFTRDALALIAQHSEGIPRNINNLCFNSLALASAMGQKPIDAGIIREVVGDLSLERFRKPAALAAPKQQKPATPFAGFSIAALPDRWSAGSMVKVAVTAAIVLVVVATLLLGYRKQAARAGSRNSSVFAAPAPESHVAAAPESHVAAAPSVHTEGQAIRAVPPLASQAEPAAEAEAKMIRVLPGKTLLRICIDNFGKCNPAVLQEIHRLNPRVTDLDHIEPGQSIRIPATARVSRASVAEPGAKPAAANGAASE